MRKPAGRVTVHANRSARRSDGRTANKVFIKRLVFLKMRWS